MQDLELTSRKALQKSLGDGRATALHKKLGNRSDAGSPSLRILKAPNLSIKNPLIGRMITLGMVIAIRTELNRSTDPALFISDETWSTR